MPDLFDTAPAGDPPAAKGPRPLADRLRPARLADVIGQDHLLGPEGALRVMLDAGALTSLILWGPPGVGKTTIARLLAQETHLHFVQISAIFTGVPDLRRVFEAAKLRHANGQGTLLFVDEIHRFNKAQQDGQFRVERGAHVPRAGAGAEPAGRRRAGKAHRPCRA